MAAFALRDRRFHERGYPFAKNSSNVRGSRPVSSRTAVVSSDIALAAISA
ncbi:hypothetical protein [Streptomyces sp. 35G-GA-8]|nr:hypothetical protein [Streptomyces sp. 35G-GA-8]MCL7380476.1 hypothetical protein [Streptomyces sp. 35G-GA-8]